MTKVATFFGSAFSTWIREQHLLDSREFGLDVTDNDFCLHYFKKRSVVCIMHIEVKTGEATATRAQVETLSLTAQAFRAMERLGEPLETYRGKKCVKYLGYHQLHFAGEWFEGRVTWDNVMVKDEAHLLRILRLEEEDGYYGFGAVERAFQHWLGVARQNLARAKN